MKIRITVGWLMVLGIGGLLVRWFVFGGHIPQQGYTWGELSGFDQFLVGYGVVSGIGLWLWMFADYFRERPLRFSILWGFSLLIFLYIAAVVYFIVIYLRRVKRVAQRE